MATKKLFGALLLSVLFAFTSCIQEEALNAECDIIAVKATWLETNKDILSGTPVISNNEVRFYVKEGTNIETLKTLDPEFELTPGAIIEKESKIEENGDKGVYMYYNTKSEDRVWGKRYKVSFTIQTVIDIDRAFSFEHFELDNGGLYYIWHEEDASGTKLDWWASGNEGFLMSNQGKTPESFPTTVDPAGFKGCCVRLTTRSTGPFGIMFGKPIAAGNIFIGEFNAKEAALKPLEATRFGLAITPSKPVSLTGYYKYTAGEVFTNANNEIIDEHDTCSIYSVLYEIDPTNIKQLNGSNVLSDECIVMVAELTNPGEPTEWTEFDIPYVTRSGKAFDFDKLKNGEYAITVVASSSKGGAFFEGAVGSTLLIDEIKINWDNE